MKEAEIKNLSGAIYERVKKDNINRRISNKLQIPQKDIISIQQELEQSIGQ